MQGWGLQSWGSLLRSSGAGGDRGPEDSQCHLQPAGQCLFLPKGVFQGLAVPQTRPYPGQVSVSVLLCSHQTQPGVRAGSEPRNTHPKLALRVIVPWRTRDTPRVGQLPSEQGGGERDVGVRRVPGARAGQCPLLSPGTPVVTPAVIRALLKQQIGNKDLPSELWEPVEALQPDVCAGKLQLKSASSSW